jgi:hypothetical protein
MEWRGLRNFQHTQGKVFRIPHFEKTWFQQGFHSTHWSAFGISVILGQLDEEGKYVITYASWSNNKAENKYSSYGGECLAVIWAIKHFRPYFYGTKFILYTDHQPIKWLMTNERLINKLTHWTFILQEYEFKIIHQHGITYHNADTLSDALPRHGV